MLSQNAVASSLPVPEWPELRAAQKAEALAAGWPGRLEEALRSAALLGIVAAIISFLFNAASIAWPTVLSLVLSGACAGLYARSRAGSIPKSWLGPIGLATLAATHLILMACLSQRVVSGGGRMAAADPVFILLTLMLGTLWALRMHLAPKAFGLTAAFTAAVLWAPWLVVTPAPTQFGLAAVISIAAGVQLRWIAAERAFDVYRREVIWPQLWRRISGKAPQGGPSPGDGAIERVSEQHSPAGDQRAEESVAKLAAALAQFKTQKPEHVDREARKGGS